MGITEVHQVEATDRANVKKLRQGFWQLHGSVPPILQTYGPPQPSREELLSYLEDEAPLTLLGRPLRDPALEAWVQSEIPKKTSEPPRPGTCSFWAYRIGTSTPRSGRIPQRGPFFNPTMVGKGRPSAVGPPPPGQVAANAALAAAAAVFNGAEPPRRGGSSGTNSSTISISQLFAKGPSSSTKALSPRGSIRRTKSASNVATFGPTAPLRPVQRTVPSVSVELEK
eukprot:s3383_g1.t1